MNPGDRVRISKETETYEGIVLPSTTPETIVIKRSGGY
ncbi:MAG: hypothetical protein ABEI06_01420, partial [Halobacteriaceae archaeon]